MHQTLLDCTQLDKSLCCLIGERRGEAFLSFLPCNGGDGKEKTKTGPSRDDRILQYSSGADFLFHLSGVSSSPWSSASPAAPESRELHSDSQVPAWKT